MLCPLSTDGALPQARPILVDDSGYKEEERVTQGKQGFVHFGTQPNRSSVCSSFMSVCKSCIWVLLAHL